MTCRHAEALAFYRSSPSLRDFIRGLLDWLYEHPFPHAVSQRALSAFLGEARLQVRTLPNGLCA